MTKPTTQEIALDCIKRLLTHRDELHAKDIIEAICIEIGKNKKAASNYITQAFDRNIIVRSLEMESNGYRYRLKARFPEWGTSEPKRGEYKPRKANVVESCKATSHIYQFDQLLRGCHG